MTYSRVAVENGLLNEPPFEVKQAMMELVKRLITAVAAGLWEADCDHKWLSESGSEQVGGWRVFEPACEGGGCGLLCA